MDRLTAQDLLLLWPEELGWSQDIGALALLDGTAPFVFPTGLLAAAVIAGALHTYRREYLVVTRPGAVA